MAYLLTVAQKINIDLSALWLCKKPLEKKTEQNHGASTAQCLGDSVRGPLSKSNESAFQSHQLQRVVDAGRTSGGCLAQLPAPPCAGRRSHF